MREEAPAVLRDTGEPQTRKFRLPAPDSAAEAEERLEVVRSAADGQELGAGHTVWQIHVPEGVEKVLEGGEVGFNDARENRSPV